MSGADYRTDHRLVRAPVSLAIQRPHRKLPHRKFAPKLLRRLDTARLNDPATNQLLSANIKTAVYISVEVFKNYFRIPYLNYLLVARAILGYRNCKKVLTKFTKKVKSVVKTRF